LNAHPPKLAIDDLLHVLSTLTPYIYHDFGHSGAPFETALTAFKLVQAEGAHRLQHQLGLLGQG
jgi:hypothetical protein